MGGGEEDAPLPRQRLPGSTHAHAAAMRPRSLCAPHFPPYPPPPHTHTPEQQATNTIRVYNNGLGIPVEVHKEEGVYVPELIFGHLLTSSNYNDKDAKVRTGGGGGGEGGERGGACVEGLCCPCV